MGEACKGRKSLEHIELRNVQSQNFKNLTSDHRLFWVENNGTWEKMNAAQNIDCPIVDIMQGSTKAVEFEWDNKHGKYAQDSLTVDSKEVIENQFKPSITNEYNETRQIADTNPETEVNQRKPEIQSPTAKVNVKIRKDDEQTERSKQTEVIRHGIQGMISTEEVTLTRQANSWQTTITDQEEVPLMKGTLDSYKWALLCRKGLIKYEFYDPLVYKADPKYEVIKINYIMNSPKGINCIRNEFTVSINDQYIGKIIAKCVGFNIHDKNGEKIFKINKRGFFNMCSNTTTYHIKKTKNENANVGKVKSSTEKGDDDAESENSTSAVAFCADEGIIVVKTPDYPKKTTYTLKHICSDISNFSLLVALLFRMLADSLMSF